MIDHTGHPHPSTPKARALCRANGGTGFIGKIGAHAPVATKSDHGKTPHVPQGPVNVKPTTPKVPSGPPVKKGDTVPKSHGVAKPATPPPPARKGRAGGAKKSTIPANVAPKLAPTSTAPTGGIPRVTLPPKTSAVPPKNLAGTMGAFIPRATGNTEEDKIQNALRLGASRDFIVSKSKLQRDEADAAIDRILTRSGVPNHIYPRLGTPNAKAPKATAVKTPPIGSPLGKLKAGGRVEAPGGPPSPALRSVQGKTRLNRPDMNQRAHRVAAIQESQIGDKIGRIKSIESGIPTGEAYQGLENANGTCLNGHIHIHKNFHERLGSEAAGRTSGFKVRGGDDPLETTIAHEMGHAFLTNYDINADQRRTIAESMIKSLGLKDPSPGQGWSFNRIDDLIKQNRATISRYVSKYAATNSNEFIAEVWADYTMNPKPSPHIKQMGDEIKRVIKTLPSFRKG